MLVLGRVTDIPPTGQVTRNSVEAAERLVNELVQDREMFFFSDSMNKKFDGWVGCGFSEIAVF